MTPRGERAITGLAPGSRRVGRRAGTADTGVRRGRLADRWRTFTAHTARRLFGAGLAALLAACAPAPSDETPLGALRMFLRAMERSGSDSTALEEAYGLLDAGARTALEQRARDASALANGREFAPWEMLAQGRYRVRFAYAEYGAMRESVDGERATVTVVGTDRASHAEVPLVREEGRWRVVLHVPPPPPAAPAPAEAPPAP